VAWPAILGGAFAAAAISILLVALGAGLGLSSVSPWSNSGTSITTFTAASAIWLIVVQWVASGLGGYLTGRLRTKWANLHTDEVFFRDTAHGFLAWAVASVITAAFLASAASSVVSGGAHMATSVASGAAAGASQGATQSGSSIPDPIAYYVDSLYRSDRPAANASDQDVKAETGRILAMGLKNGSVPDADKARLSQMVAARTGMSREDADKRVNDVLAQEQAAEAKARQAADQARKAAASASFYVFFSMLIGAFIASVAGALGGRQRDEI
jgi:hypothetical protein